MARENKNPISETGLFRRYPGIKRVGFRGKRRIPTVLQLSATECGAACLTMVAGTLGKEMGLQEVRNLCGPCRDGVSALSILKAAEPLAMRGRGIKVDMTQLELLEPGLTILHWQFAHFVVFGGVRRKHILIYDPAVGRRKISFEQFSKDFTGVALVFEPTEFFKTQERERIVFATIKSLVLQSGLLPKILLMSLVLQVLHLAMPILTGQLIDRVLPRGDFSLLTVLMAGIVLMVTFQAIGGLVREHLLLHMRTVLDVRMTLGFLDHLVSLPYSYFQLRGSADLVSRIHSNQAVRDHLTSTTLSASLDGLLVVVYLGILTIGDFPMAIATVVVGALDIGVYFVSRQRQLDLMGQGFEVDTKAQGYELEMLNSIETLKASGNEHRAVTHWSNLFVDSINVSLARARLQMKSDAALGILRSAGPLAILATGALRVMNGHVSLGSMLALNAVTAEFLGPLLGLVGTAASLDLVRSNLERVNDVLEAEPEQDVGSVKPAPALQGGIELEHVSFGYSSDGPLVLDDICVKIEPGQFIAIVGRSGSGKTTLANIVIGLYKPVSGRILFDGYDMAELELRSIRQQIGIVNQKLALFGSSIRDNIALSDPGLTLEQVSEAARLACVHDEIAAMPLGYSTPLVDGGATISGGQKQRIALARALVRRPAILLLDEATSALDALTEREVQKSLDSQQCTRIVIAHRLSTVRKADMILVVDEGTIKEFGDHETLMAQGGFYATLVSTQIEGPQSAPKSNAGDDAAPAEVYAASDEPYPAVEEPYADPSAGQDSSIDPLAQPMDSMPLSQPLSDDDKTEISVPRYELNDPTVIAASRMVPQLRGETMAAVIGGSSARPPPIPAIPPELKAKLRRVLTSSRRDPNRGGG